MDAAKKIADAKKLLDSFGGDRVRCEVHPLTPRLSIRLRLRSGYLWLLPLSDSQVGERKWIALGRVTPKGGNQNPLYFSDVVHFPNSGDIGTACLASKRLERQFGLQR